MQTIAVVIIVSVAVGFALWRVYQNFRHTDDPCRGCALKESCMKNGNQHKGHDGCKNGGHKCPNC